MFGFIKNKIKKVYANFTQKISTLFSRTSFDQLFLDELFKLLITADTGIKTSKKIIQKLKETILLKNISTPDEVKKELMSILISYLPTVDPTKKNPPVILLVGVNGTGKTSFAAKLAYDLQKQGKKILLVAADTFRAAATEQLKTWGSRLNIPVFTSEKNSDPASVVFDACAFFKKENFDHLIIDTAGRLQTKVNLMRELEKIQSVIGKQLPQKNVGTWIAIDSMLGQNSLAQAKIFNQATQLDGLILTKLDGTAKGGIVFSITQELNVPLLYITFGEQVDDIKVFDPVDYVSELLGHEE